MKQYYHDHMSLRVPGDDLKDHRPDAPTQKDFKFYTMDLSYFCGKLEMYFRYKEISFDRIEPTAKEFFDILYVNTGTEQVPQVYDTRDSTPDSKRWLRDTTFIIQHLENDPQISSSSKPVIPECPVQAFFSLLLEDYADEYLWRPAMFWRWEPRFDRFIMGFRFWYEFCRELHWRWSFMPHFATPRALSLRQWLVSSYGEDCDTQAKKDVVKMQYLELLDIMEGILSKQPYLFGNYPTLVDFGFAGPFFRHFSSDFTPRKVMQQRAPAVYEWVARLWNCKGSKLQGESGFPPFGTLPQNWAPLLSLLPEYLEYFHLNAVAYRDGRREFSWTNKGQVFKVPVVKYRVFCRMKLQQAYMDLPDEKTKGEVRRLLEQWGCWALLWEDGVIEVEAELGTEPPFVLYPAPPRHAFNLSAIHNYKWDYDRIIFRFFGSVGFRLVGVVGAIGVTSWMLFKRRM